MKVILTGSTGFIGREVLEQCVRDPSITSIIALSRRAIPYSVANSPKLKVTVMTDFTSYPEALLQDIRGAEACIWSLGKARMSDIDTARKVSIDYTLAAANAFSQDSASKQGTGRKFRFVYLSGAATERDQTKPLWFMQDYRRIRGEVENRLISHARENPEYFEAYIMRPGFVLAKETNMRDLVRGLGPSVRVDLLAAAMVAIALNGSEHQILENATIRQFGG